MEPALEESLFAPNGALVTRLKGQTTSHLPAGTTPAFYRNLEEILEVRRGAGSLYSIVRHEWIEDGVVDFCSNDLLYLSQSGILRAEYLEELARYPNFPTTSGGSRLVNGNYDYLDQAEREIANFHGYEAGLIANSGFDANVVIWTAIPRLGDVLLYDEASHASTYDGMSQSLARDKVEFLHNDTESFRDALADILESHPLVRQGKRCVLVSVESVYSMSGDICPLRELIDIAKDVSGGQGNVQFVVDEAHSTGLLGPDGKGLVCELGLEKEVAVVLHSFAKAVGSHGAIITGNKTIKTVLLNHARSYQFTTAPPFTLIALIKAGYALLSSGRAREKQANVQYLMRVFLEFLTSHPKWREAEEMGILSVPLAKDWEEKTFHSHIVAIRTRQRYTYWLYFHLLFSGYSVWPVEHPLVPIGQSRLKVTVHGGNTEEQVEGMVDAIYAWVDEIMAIENSSNPMRVSSAAAKVYGWMKQEGLRGFGMP